MTKRERAMILVLTETPEQIVTNDENLIGNPVLFHHSKPLNHGRTSVKINSVDSMTLLIANE